MDDALRCGHGGRDRCGYGLGRLAGVTWQLASIASLVLGYMVSHPLSAQLAPYFPGEPVVARALAMLAVYCAVSGGSSRRPGWSARRCGG